MRIKVLGCGGSAGVPLIGGPDGLGEWGVCDPTEPRNRRTRASILIETGTANLLIDTSPDMRSQLLANGVQRVDSILFTHAHADHINGLDDVRVLNRIVNRPIAAWGTEATLAEISKRFDYAFREWTGPGFFRPVLEARPIVAGDVFTTQGVTVRSFLQDHGFGPSLGMRVGDFAYSTDVVRLDDAAFAVLEGVDTWLVDCFQRAPHQTHVNVEQVMLWAKRVGARRTVLTHMGADMDWSWMRANLPDGIEPAYDGMTINLPTG